MVLSKTPRAINLLGPGAILAPFFKSALRVVFVSSTKRDDSHNSLFSLREFVFSLMEF
jgi:hypothetical protein